MIVPGPSECDEFVEQGEQLHVAAAHQRGLIGGQHHVGNRIEDHVELRAEHVGEDHLFRALGLAHALVIGQIEGDGLDSGHIVAAAVDLVRHRNRAFEAAREIVVLRVDRQVAFHIAQVADIAIERGAFLGIAQGDEALERGLGAVEPVGIDFVGADGDFDGGAAEGPSTPFRFRNSRHRKEAVGAQGEEALEAGVGGDRRRFAQQFGGGLEEFGVFLANRARR